LQLKEIIKDNVELNIQHLKNAFISPETQNTMKNILFEQYTSKIIKSIISQNKLEEFKKMMDYSFELTTEILEYAFTTSHTEIIKEILNYKIVPNNKCFVNFVNKLVLDYNSGLYREKTKINDYGYFSGYNIEKNNEFQLLKSSGYKFTQDDLLLLTEEFLYIENYKSLGLIFDENIKALCKNMTFFPYNTEIEKESILKCLKNNSTVKCVKNLMNKYDAKPDKDYIAVLLSANTAIAFKAIEFIRKKITLHITNNDFFDICKKIVELSPNRYYQSCGYALQFLKSFYKSESFNYDTYEPNKQEQNIYVDRQKLYKNLIDRNNNINEKIFGDALTTQNHNFTEDDKYIGELLIKYNVKCNINIIKILCHRIFNNTTQFICKCKCLDNIMKIYNLQFDFECYMIMLRHGVLFYYISAIKK
jgi:hypothetical protein